MFKNKSFFLILSMFVLALILVACGNGDNETSNGSTNSNKQESNDDYPSKAISAIVPWAAGSGSDIAFRGYAEYVSDELGQNINVQNVTGDRKSTRLNSSHVAISYAVFCLKK